MLTYVIDTLTIFIECFYYQPLVTLPTLNYLWNTTAALITNSFKIRNFSSYHLELTNSVWDFLTPGNTVYYFKSANGTLSIPISPLLRHISALIQNQYHQLLSVNKLSRQVYTANTDVMIALSVSLSFSPVVEFSQWVVILYYHVDVSW